MDISFTSTAVILCFCLAVASLLLLISWVQHRTRPALGLWGLAFALGCIAVGLIGARGQIPDFISIVVANALMAAGYGVMWSAARKFDGRSLLVPASLTGVGLWLAAMLIPAWYATPVARASLTMLIGIVYTLLTAFELWRARGDGLPSRWLTVALLVLHAASLPLRVVVIAGSGGAVPSHAHLLTFILLESMLLAIAGTYLFGSLVRERIASGYKHAASIDPLTGVANRRAFLHQGGRLLQRARTDGRAYSLLLFDLDQFKAINDAFGHAAGDDVLTTFCSTAIGQLRPGDLFGRIGGEEFACLLVGASASDAVIVAERIRFAFEGAVHRSSTGTFGATVSVGLATGSNTHPDMPSLLLSADRALYRAKQDGRNRVVEDGLVRSLPEPLRGTRHG